MYPPHCKWIHWGVGWFYKRFVKSEECASPWIFCRSSVREIQRGFLSPWICYWPLDLPEGNFWSMDLIEAGFLDHHYSYREFVAPFVREGAGGWGIWCLDLPGPWMFVDEVTGTLLIDDDPSSTILYAHYVWYFCTLYMQLHVISCHVIGLYPSEYWLRLATVHVSRDLRDCLVHMHLLLYAGYTHYYYYYYYSLYYIFSHFLFYLL